MKQMMILMAGTIAATALLSAPAPVQAQSGDPVLRMLNSVLQNGDFRALRGGWDDDDDDGRASSRDDDDDDGRGGRSDDDDDDGGDDNDD